MNALSRGNTKRWLPVALCVALIVLELGVWAGLHRSDEEIERAWRVGPPKERVAALNILANRGEPSPRRFDEDFVHSLLREPDLLLREAAFTSQVCKFHEPVLQKTYLVSARVDPAHWWRSYLIHRRKTGGQALAGGAGLSHRELAWYFQALHDRPPPLDEIDTYLRNRLDRSRQRKASHEQLERDAGRPR